MPCRSSDWFLYEMRHCDKRVKKVFSVAIQLETIEPLMTKKSTMSSVDDTDTKKINRQIKF